MFGGAFNPPHIGHMICAAEAAAALGLDRILFVPAGRPPHRAIEPEPGGDVRLELARAAVEEDERFEASDLEVRRAGPSYACDTLEELASDLRQEELVLVIGADQAAAFARWDRPGRIGELARVAVAARPGTERDAAEAGLAEAGVADRSVAFEMPAIGVSSTLVRERVGQGRDVRYLVPAGVSRLIAEKGLYT